MGSMAAANAMKADMDMDALYENAERASLLLRTMSNQWRLLILCHLAQGELSVHQLEKMIGLSQSALSQHLAILRRERLVRTRREAQSIFYSLASPEAGAVMQTLYDLYCSDEAVSAAPARR